MFTSRHLNALLNAEDALGLAIDEDAVDKHARAAFFSYSQAPLPLHRVGQHANGEGTPTQLAEHNLREGFHALYALAKYRDSDRAWELAARSIDCINEYWLPDETWQTERVGRELGVDFTQGYGTFIQRPARAIGPLVKHYRATGHGPALQLALALADKALRECFRPDGGFSNQVFGTHAHIRSSTRSGTPGRGSQRAKAVVIQRLERREIAVVVIPVALGAGAGVADGVVDQVHDRPPP